MPLFDEMEEEFRRAGSVEEARRLLDKYCVNYITCVYAELLYAEAKRRLTRSAEVEG